MKALEAARDRALADNRDWLSEAWLLTVASELEEGDTLLRELDYAPQQVHNSDVLALSQGAEETTRDMAPALKVRHLLGGSSPSWWTAKG